MAFDKNNYLPGTHPDLPPPPGTVGVVGWLKNNLFSSLSNSILTLLSLYLLYLLIEGGLSWFVVDAVVDANDKPGCRKIADGACWAVIVKRFDQFIYGFYPLAERWRIDVSFCLLFIAAAPLLYPDIKFRKYMLVFSCLYPFIAFILIKGGLFNLLMIETNLFGGAMLTVIIGVTSIACSLPLGILLALGRQSRLKLVKVISVCFIEFMRGVPLITLLFVASTMLNYFLPPGTNFNLLIRVIIMMTFFSAAYIAEVIRGGIQAIPKGQYEAADAIGMSPFQKISLIIMPQALRAVIPTLVSSAITAFKDSSLVTIIGLFDFLTIGKTVIGNQSIPVNFVGHDRENLIFVAIVYWIFTFTLSRRSMKVEKKLGLGER